MCVTVPAVVIMAVVVTRCLTGEKREARMTVRSVMMMLMGPQPVLVFERPIHIIKVPLNNYRPTAPIARSGALTASRTADLCGLGRCSCP
jgi:hypothetical protein